MNNPFIPPIKSNHEKQKLKKIKKKKRSKCTGATLLQSDLEPSQAKRNTK